MCLQGFNEGLEELCKIQKGWAVPDKEQRDAIRQAQKRVVSDAYKAFLQRCVCDASAHISCVIYTCIRHVFVHMLIFVFTDVQTFRSPKIQRNISGTRQSRWKK